MIGMKKSLKQRDQWYGYIQSHLDEQREKEKAEQERMKAHFLNLKKLHEKR